LGNFVGKIVSQVFFTIATEGEISTLTGQTKNLIGQKRNKEKFTFFSF